MPLSVRSKATSVVVSAPSKLFEFAQILSSYIRRLISIHWFSTSMKSKDCVSKRAVRLDGPSRRGTPASTAVQPHTPAIRYGITTGLGIEHHGTTRCYYPYTRRCSTRAIPWMYVTSIELLGTTGCTLSRFECLCGEQTSFSLL